MRRARYCMTAVLPLPSAALAMIAQRKPMQDKGFEELQRSLRVSPMESAVFDLDGTLLTARHQFLSPSSVGFCQRGAPRIAPAVRETRTGRAFSGSPPMSVRVFFHHA